MKNLSFHIESLPGPDSRRIAVTSETGVAVVASRCFPGFEKLVKSTIASLEQYDPDEIWLRMAFEAIDGKARDLRPEGHFPSMVMAAVDSKRNAVHIAHIGDARAYLLRQNVLERRPASPAPQYSPAEQLADGSTLVCLTYDHTTACELVELGMIERFEGRQRAKRPILTHYVGAVPPSEPDIFSVDLVSGDRVLLCTSDLWLNCDDEHIGQTLQAEQHPNSAFDELMESAGPLPMALIDCTTGSAAARLERMRSGVLSELTPPPPQAPSASSKSDSVLDQLGRDLTAWTEDKPANSFVGREQQLRELMRSLMRLRKSNVLIVGDPGVGKTWLVEALAARMRTGPCPPALRGKRVVELSMGSLVSGTRYRGDFEARIEAILAEAASDETLLLFIDEVHLALQSGSTSDGSMDAANLLKPALARGELTMIGATTSKEFDRHVARDEAFLRRFEVIRLDEPSVADTKAILGRMAGELESHHGLRLGGEAIDAAIELSVRHMVDRRLPDKAIDLLDQACTRAASRWMSMSIASAANANATGIEVERADVAAVVARRCGVPLDLILLDDEQRLAKLDVLLAERIIGQPGAVALTSDAIRNSYAGLKHPNKPVASLLFVGPTGVGKTEMARALAELVFASEDALMRLDMSEYMEKHAVARLLGAAPGYVGHDAGGQLSAGLRARPGTVVLFDEIEKAHPDVLQILLQILDNGSVRDSRGDDVSFRDAIVILTSNLTVKAERNIGFGRSQDEGGSPSDEAVREQLRGSIKPELLGRLSRVVPFTHLPIEALGAIADRQLQLLLERVLAGEVASAPPRSLRKRIHGQLARTTFGARDIARLVEAEVGKWLTASRQSAEGAVVSGTVVVDRLPKQRRTSVALVHIESTAELATPKPEVDRMVHGLVDDIVGSALGVELRYLHYTPRGVLAVFGGVLGANALVDGLGDDWRCVVHWGRIERDAAGHPSGTAVDRLLAVARNTDDARHVTLEAREQLGVTT